MKADWVVASDDLEELHEADLDLVRLAGTKWLLWSR